MKTVLLDERFFLDHGMIHDRVTGKHVTTDGSPPFEDGVADVCVLLNDLAKCNPLKAKITEFLDDTYRHEETLIAGGLDTIHVSRSRTMRESLLVIMDEMC